MKPSPASRFRNSFTLLELLVGIAILALMTVFLTQIIVISSQTWQQGQARADDFSKARALLDLLTSDLKNGVYREDLCAFPGSAVAFYTRRSGFSEGSSVRDVSLVRYTLNTNSVLQRADMPINWTDQATIISFGNTNALPNLSSVNSRDTSDGVVGFKVLFLGTDGRLSSTYAPANGLRGFSIGLAVVDKQTLKKLTSTQLGTLQSALQNQVTGTNSLKIEWENYLATGMDWSVYPQNMGSGFKIFERYVSLP